MLKSKREGKEGDHLNRWIMGQHGCSYEGGGSSYRYIMSEGVSERFFGLGCKYMHTQLPETQEILKEVLEADLCLCCEAQDLRTFENPPEETKHGLQSLRSFPSFTCGCHKAVGSSRSSCTVVDFCIVLNGNGVNMGIFWGVLLAFIGVLFCFNPKSV